MSESTPAAATVSTNDIPPTSLRLGPLPLCLLISVILSVGSVLADEQGRTVKVAFRVQPSYFKAYLSTKERAADYIELKGGVGVLQLPKSFDQGQESLRVRFSVDTWSGEYPDWRQMQSGEELAAQSLAGFALDIPAAQLRGTQASVPAGGDSFRLPLPASVALSAWTYHHRGLTLVLLGVLAATPALLRKLWGRIRFAPSEGPLVADYQLSRKLGEGGMGEVWAARSLSQADCALKFIKKEFASDEEFKQRFEREVEVWLPLEHPNLLKLHGYGVARDGRLFTVSELLEGETLKQVLLGSDYDPPQLASLVLDEIGDALFYLHERGFVHRDIKPDNIFRRGNGTLKLMDMGLLRAESRTSANQAHLTQTGQLLGTPAYMPPEQLEGRSILSGQADQYALGVILYEILAGARPFTQSDPIILMYQHTQVAPAAPSELNPKVTPEMDSAVLRMLAKRPEERFESLPEAQRALEFLRFTSWKSS